MASTLEQMVPQMTLVEKGHMLDVVMAAIEFGYAEYGEDVIAI